MAWSNSKIFTAFVTASVNNTKGYNLASDTIENALYGTATPDQTVTAANSAYAAGVWTGGSAPNLVDTGSSAPAGWPYLGRPLGGLSSTFTTNVYTFTASNTASANSVTTITAAYGSLIYDHSTTTPAGVTDQGICFLYFGGSQSVTLGSFTVAYNASGLITLTL
jgi:hypothetical protein